MRYSNAATPLALMAAWADAHAGGHHHHHAERELSRGRTCGTTDATLEELTHDQVKVEALKEELLGIDGRRSLFIREQPVRIDTYVHILHASDGTGDIADAVVLQQIRVLNEGFSTTSIQFKLIEVNHVENDDWFESGQTLESEYKTELHVGNASTLNLYFSDLEEAEKGALLGWATYPFWYGFEPILDGVVCDYRTVPGGRFDDYNEGKTTVHEVGHWMGLSHTFNGGDCDGPGDFVSDTAAQAESTSGCPVGGQILDSCPGGGRDPVTNFMDYADDVCLTEFTPGQSERMYLHWLLYRKEDEACAPGLGLFELKVQLDDHSFETYWSLETTDGETILVSPECGTFYPLESIAGIYSKDICLPTNSYVFTFGDTFGNGLDRGSGYTITVEGEVVKEGGSFRFREVTNFDVNAGSRAPVTPQPTVAPITPTPAPTLPPIVVPPPGTTVEVTIFIAFDDYPLEIGWSLECGDQLLADFINGTYVENFSNVTDVFTVAAGNACTFTLTDSFGDGLYCDVFGTCGFYAIFINDGPVVPDTLFAESLAIETFVAQAPSPTPPPTTHPTFSPSASLAPTTGAAGDVVMVSFEVTLDDYPNEIGIMLTCADTVLYQAAPGAFLDRNDETIAATFDVPRSASCTFTITDTLGDGLFCFPNGDCGFYAVFYGDDITFGPNIIANELFDDGEDTITFVATGGGGGPTRAPSVSPTVAPSTTSAPTVDGVSVRVTVVFDDFPSEIGISLVCGGQSLIDLPSLTFGEDEIMTKFQETVSVQAGSQCTFLLTDSAGDGLCIRSAFCGSYELMVGDAVLQSGSEFTDVVEVRFLPGISETVPSAPTPTVAAPSVLSPDGVDGSSSGFARSLALVFGIVGMIALVLAFHRLIFVRFGIPKPPTTNSPTTAIDAEVPTTKASTPTIDTGAPTTYPPTTAAETGNGTTDMPTTSIVTGTPTASAICTSIATDSPTMLAPTPSIDTASPTKNSTTTAVASEAPTTKAPTATIDTGAPTTSPPTTAVATRNGTTDVPTTSIVTGTLTASGIRTSIATDSPTMLAPTLSIDTASPTTNLTTTAVASEAPTTEAPTATIDTGAPTTTAPAAANDTGAPSTSVSMLTTVSIGDSTTSAPITSVSTETQMTSVPTTSIATGNLTTSAPATSIASDSLTTALPTTSNDIGTLRMSVPITSIATGTPTTSAPTTSVDTGTPTTLAPITSIVTRTPTMSAPTTSIETRSTSAPIAAVAAGNPKTSAPTTTIGAT